jgi:predicted Zn-dependent protease with MMP-like domain
MSSEAEKVCTNLLQTFANIPKQFERNQELIKACEDEIQDILHEIELGKDQDLLGAYNMYVAIRDNRRYRRRLKDENETLQPLVNFLKNHENFRMKLCQVHSQIKKVENQLENREYHPRIRDDLSIAK